MNVFHLGTMRGRRHGARASRCLGRATARPLDAVPAQASQGRHGVRTAPCALNYPMRTQHQLIDHTTKKRLTSAFRSEQLRAPRCVALAFRCRAQDMSPRSRATQLRLSQVGILDDVPCLRTPTTLSGSKARRSNYGTCIVQQLSKNHLDFNRVLQSAVMRRRWRCSF
jgi:hypothetical protein